MTAYLLPFTINAETKQTIIVGLTGSALLKNKTHGQLLMPWTNRCNSVVAFICAIALLPIPPSTRAESSNLETTDRLQKYLLDSNIVLEIHEIQDAYGPTITMEEVSCLTVSEETKDGGKAVNVKREEKNWRLLEVFTVGLVEGDGEGKLSSTKIRARRLAALESSL